jgi:hypothetical protein
VGAGVLHYLVELVGDAKTLLEPALSDRIINILGANSLHTLVNLILTNHAFRYCYTSVCFSFGVGFAFDLFPYRGEIKLVIIKEKLKQITH